MIKAVEYQIFAPFANYNHLLLHYILYLKNRNVTQLAKFYLVYLQIPKRPLKLNKDNS